MDYSKLINLDTWPEKPEEKKIAEIDPKDEIMDSIKQHFKDNPEALAEFQKEIRDQQTEPIKQEVKPLISPEDFQDYLKSKK